MPGYIVPKPTATESQYLWEEYKLLQDKLDKLGAFRFQVKGWLVALISALLISGYAAKIPVVTFGAAIIVILCFWVFEQYQAELHQGFSRRVIQLERLLERRDRVQFFGMPATRTRYSRFRDLRKIPPSSPANAVLLVHLDLRRRKTKLSWLILHAHETFNVVLLLIVVVLGVISVIRSEAPSAEQMDVRGHLHLQSAPATAVAKQQQLDLNGNISFRSSPVSEAGVDLFDAGFAPAAPVGVVDAETSSSPDGAGDHRDAVPNSDVDGASQMVPADSGPARTRESRPQ